MAGSKWYAVRRGRQPGVYATWPECETQVKGFSGAQFKSFPSREDAEAFAGAEPIRSSTARSTAPSVAADEPNRLYYAVARGHQTGIFRTWYGGALEATHRYAGAVFKSFRRAEEAEAFLRVHGVNPFERHEFAAAAAGLVKVEDFRPDNKAPLDDEFDRLASSQGWHQGSQEYTSNRTSFLGRELVRHYFFDGDGANADTIKEEEADDGADAHRIKEEEADDDGVGVKMEPGALTLRPARRLVGFQRLCRQVGIDDPPDTVQECKDLLKGVLVNIVDLVDAKRAGKAVVVWTDFQAFRDYTLQASGPKRINLRQAKQDEMMACFLQRLRGAGGRGDAEHVRAASRLAARNRVTHGRVVKREAGASGTQARARTGTRGVHLGRHS